VCLARLRIVVNAFHCVVGFPHRYVLIASHGFLCITFIALHSLKATDTLLVIFDTDFLGCCCRSRISRSRNPYPLFAHPNVPDGSLKVTGPVVDLVQVGDREKPERLPAKVRVRLGMVFVLYAGVRIEGVNILVSFQVFFQARRLKGSTNGR
jgi:hypothetical protein